MHGGYAELQRHRGTRLSCFSSFSRQNPRNLYSGLLATTSSTTNDMSGVDVILGVVAGGAGLASLSMQLAESANKLKRLYHSMKDAPSTLKEIADEIEIMSLSLRHLEQHH